MTTGEYSQRSVTLSWTATQDIANNKSTIKWTLKGSGSYSGWVRVSEVRIKIDGSQVFYRDSSHHTDAYNGTQICSGSKTLNHNADGSKSFSISVEAGIYEWAINKSKSKTFSLNVIPRASSISCGTLTMGSAGTISVSRASTSFTHTITYLYGTKSGTICTKSSSTSVSWTPPLDLAHMVPNATFVEWFIPDEQKAIIQITRDMVHEIFLANEICPQFISECDERRIHQDLALGYCENLIQELQYIITTLPVNIEKYENITNMIMQEQVLIKGWRKSDNKIRKSILDREKESVTA